MRRTIDRWGLRLLKKGERPGKGKVGQNEARRHRSGEKSPLILIPSRDVDTPNEK
jgi:hypothetical protein